MEVLQTLHMNKGTGETSYAKNSTVQREIISHGNSILEEAVAECLRKTQPESMGIADLGCGSGPNSLMVVSQIINTVCSKMGGSMPELRVSLNDLPQNDFNELFMSLSEFYDKLRKEKGNGLDGHFFFSVVAGSFYGRLFPKNSLNFVHSSSSLHWLSQVPQSLGRKTGGNVYISKTSPKSVVKAYVEQFERDFSTFLRLRGEETVGGGGMVLSFMGQIPSKLCCPQWDLLAQALMSMASQGLVDEEKIDSFNAPYYAPTPEEVANVIQEEGSFTLNHLKAFEIEWLEEGRMDGSYESMPTTLLSKGEQVARNMRVVIESTLESHFGTEVMDDLFSRYGKLFDEYLSDDGTKLINLVVSVTKKYKMGNESMKTSE